MLQGFTFHAFYWSFSSVFMAVQGLKKNLSNTVSAVQTKTRQIMKRETLYRLQIIIENGEQGNTNSNTNRKS